MPLSFENVASGVFASGSAVLQEMLSPNTNFPQLITVGPVAIQREENARVVFAWNQTGPMVPFMQGEWRFDVFFEQMGPSEGPGIAFTHTPFVPVIGAYTFICPIPANTVPVGLYRVTVRMMLVPTSSATAFSDTSVSPIVAFEDLGLVQYHNA
jgi:hypothetical protein